MCIRDRLWTPLKAGFPSCSAANGADTSNDDEDEWDYNTMFSTRSELNTIAAIENITEIEYVQARCPESRKPGADIASRFIPRELLGFVHVGQTQNNTLSKSWCSTVQFPYSAPRSICTICCVSVFVLTIALLR